MPIRPEERHRYASNWPDISLRMRELADWRCEGSPTYPDCRAEGYKPHPETGSAVVLTVAHLDHHPENNDPTNLRVWCQCCHLTYDAAQHQQTRVRREHDEADTRDFVEESQW